eukprot:TRINITY_DN9054_c1_g4_i1.p1 TRINITY_DN9054_c1_g4~~TRINITY_DN9054_c1_g4_i1.p1  ORF type:complete len:372 (-),score=46.17 TRINITY_DN9054_c1_g4_i1:55-1170(-)
MRQRRVGLGRYVFIFCLVCAPLVPLIFEQSQRLFVLPVTSSLNPAASTRIGNFHGSATSATASPFFISEEVFRLKDPKSIRRASVSDKAMDLVFGNKDKVDVPQTTEDLIERLQEIILTCLSEELPMVDVDLPPGLILGVQPGYEIGVLRPQKDLSKEDVMRGDRELAAAFVTLFVSMQVDTSAVVLFRTAKLAKLAREGWKKFGKVRVASFPTSTSNQGVADSMDTLVALNKAMGKSRPFIVVVGPREKQLKMLKEYQETFGDEGKSRFVLLNSRLRALEDKDSIRGQLGDQSNPIFHLSLVGPNAEAILFRDYTTPWVIHKREENRVFRGEDGELKLKEAVELWRSDKEPNLEDAKRAATSEGGWLPFR